ncbi:helix-turn-helix domain-containing protein [Bacteroidia bacterium]|nr:helix-turn-helix domain-containing protein [Bacteroidia bacterium]
MQRNSIIIEQTTQAELRNIIQSSVAEALESLREELKTISVSQKLTRQQVKDEFHLSFPTILKFEKQGRLKGYRIGRRVLFERSEVEASLTPRMFQ